MQKKTTLQYILFSIATFIVVFVSGFILAERTAFASLIINSWQGYRLTDGLVGYWSFDGKDMVQNVADVSGQGNNGILVGQTSTTTTIGKIGQGLSFDGVDDYVRIPNGGGLNALTEGTISMWVKWVGTQDAGYSSGIYGPVTGRQYNGNFSNNVIGLDGADPASAKIKIYPYSISSSLLGATAVGDGRWRHVVLTFVSGSQKVYLDGVLDGTLTDAGSMNNNSAVPLTIGAWIDAGVGYGKGTVDEVRTYDRVLSSEEVQRLYLMGASLKTNVSRRSEINGGLVGYWTFDGKDMTPNVRDASGQGNHGGLQNQNPTTTTIGKIGQGLSFDGVNDHIGLGVNSFNTLTNNYSFSAWVKVTQTATRNVIFSTSGGRTTFEVWSNGKPTFHYFDTVDREVYGNTVLSTDRWYHIVATKSSTAGVSVYLDGALDGSDATKTSANVAYLGDVAAMGAAFASAVMYFPLSGSIDDVRIYDRVLSAEEAKRLYLMGASLKTNVAHRDKLTNGLVEYLTFDGKDMYPNVRDSSGSGNHGSLQNQNPTTTTIGKIGQGLILDGANDYVISGINGTAFTELSLSLWVNPSGNTGTQKGILQWSNTLTDTTPFMLITRDTTNGLRLYLDNQYAATGLVIPDREWSHVVTTLNSTNLWTFYVNGVSVATYQDDASHYSQAKATSIYLGNGYNGYFAGSFDETRIYNRALSFEEVQRLYFMGK